MRHSFHRSCCASWCGHRAIKDTVRVGLNLESHGSHASDTNISYSTKPRAHSHACTVARSDVTAGPATYPVQVFHVLCVNARQIARPSNCRVAHLLQNVQGVVRIMDVHSQVPTEIESRRKSAFFHPPTPTPRTHAHVNRYLRRNVAVQQVVLDAHVEELLCALGQKHETEVGWDAHRPFVRKPGGWW